MVHAHPDELRREFESAHGHWSEELDALLAADPRYFAAYDRLLRVTAHRGALTARERELIAVAVNAQVTYLHPAATQLHIAQALRAGASEAEVMETLQLAASLGTHSMLVGVPLAHEVFARLGVAEQVADEPAQTRHRALKERFIRERRYWSPGWDTVLAYTPEYFEAYLDVSSIPWNHGELPDWFRELVYVAIDVATTHLFTAGISVHTEKALQYGASPAQVIDVMTIASSIGIDTTLMGARALVRASRVRGERTGTGQEDTPPAEEKEATT
ncbi:MULTISPECIES: carboxymuconolactone decarboxylase family protein [Brevibacterium]|uniref:Carboxymuconolactone decarboxylase-like domain-containing protein n=1 Tax=Brevibacterium salitolerans TaxID=1403566 RepID=A0ABN2WJQ0_9MICO|nr:carboxymuconolactone decarboxylase family protein [Brevibacterium sp.]